MREFKTKILATNGCSESWKKETFMFNNLYDKFPYTFGVRNYILALYDAKYTKKPGSLEVHRNIFSEKIA